MRDESLTNASTEVLEHEAVTLAAEIAASTCRWLLVIAELDRRQAWGSWGCRSMAHWVSWRCSLSQAAAYERVRVARVLAELPEVAAAFGRGEVSYSKVRVLTRVATAENEADLLDLARTATAAQLETLVRASVVAMTDPAVRDELRALYTSGDGNGMGSVRATVRIEELAIIDTAIAAAVDSPAGESIPQRRASALVKVCESFLAHGDGQRNPPARNNAVVHVDIDPNGVARAETEAGVPVHPQTAARLLCDASVQGMLGEMGHPIGIGRTSQSIPRRLRRALKKRSGGGCEWIGCQERRYVEGHHVWHWARGGPTELWNLVNLCWHHHHLVHEGGWRLAHDGRGGVRSFRPDGTELRDPVPIDIAPLQRTIDDERIVPLWCGERFDLSACVDAVLTAGSRSSA